jgi:phosphoglycerate dehydrogenase-like enzyme
MVVVMDEVVVASSAPSEASFRRLRAQGSLPYGARLVTIGDDGRPPEGLDAGTVRVLWARRVGAWGGWVSQALDHLPSLRWVHTDTVGIDHLPVRTLAERGVTLTNGAGNFSRPMAEWVLLAMLAAAKRFGDFVRRSDARVWDPSPMLRELDGTVALLLGLGSTGSLVAELAAPFGVEVRAAVRRPRSQPPAAVDKLVTGSAWREELPEADWVVLGLPATGETRHIIDTDALGAMKPDAWLINPARGVLVDEDALVAALDGGRLGGAVLDAFQTEPLPADSPLWGRDNVVIVPHHTWSSEQSLRRTEDLFAAQVSRWVRGEPMQNVIDPDNGY